MRKGKMRGLKVSVTRPNIFCSWATEVSIGRPSMMPASTWLYQELQFCTNGAWLSLNTKQPFCHGACGRSLPVFVTSLHVYGTGLYTTTKPKHIEFQPAKKKNAAAVVKSS